MDAIALYVPFGIFKPPNKNSVNGEENNNVIPAICIDEMHMYSTGHAYNSCDEINEGQAVLL